MRLSRLALTAAVVLAGAIPAGAEMRAAATAAPLAGEERVALDYQIYFGGLNIMKVGVELGLSPDAYDVAARTETIGLTGYLAPWRSHITTRGEIDGGKVEPVRHRVDAQSRGKQRNIAIDFTDGEITGLVLNPPAAKDPRDEIPAALRRGALDPASALFALVRVMGEGQGCAGRMPVFDGRRRYDVVIVDKGSDTLRAHDYSAYHGAAIRCDFHVEPIVVENAEHKRRFRSGRAWFAEVFPGRPWVPVRLEVDGDYAQTLVHLSEQPRSIVARN